MEYYGLILNRTLVAFISPEALYGWKAEKIVTNSDSKYFQPYVEMLNDPALMHNREEVHKLAGLRGGFVIPRSQILGAELIPEKKWGMGGIPHTGRIRLRLASGTTREFILLGSVDAQRIQQQILFRMPTRGNEPRAIRVPVPYDAGRQKNSGFLSLLCGWRLLGSLPPS